MQFSILERTCAAAAVGTAMLLTGCQKYEPKPLDLPGHRDAWLARTPGDEPVRAFAEQLAEPVIPAGFDPADGLTLPEAEIVALVFNPDLRLARLRAGAASATAEHAGGWDDPRLSIDVLRITESVSSPWIVTPGLAFTIPISGRLKAEKQHADAALRAELTRVAEEEWAVRRMVRQSWLRWSAAVLRAERTEALVASIESLVVSADRLVDAGEIARPEAGLFTIELAMQRQALLRYRGDASEAAQHLRALLGLSPDAPLTLIPSLAFEVTDAEDPHAAAEQRNLTLVRLREEYEVAEKSLYREIRKQYPDLTIGPLYESDQGQSRIGFLGAIPLPILNANRQGIAEARAARDFAQAAFETEYERIIGALAAARVRLNTLEQRREAMESEVVPLVDRQLADAEDLLQLGEGSSLVLLESLTRVGQTQMSLIDARLGESLAMTRLAELTGPEAPLTFEPTPQTTAQDAPETAAPADEVTP